MSFARTERECTLDRHKHIARPVNGFDQRPLVGVIFEFRPQTVDVDVKCVFFYVCGMPPASLNELFTGSNEAPMPHKGFKKFKLLSCEGDFFPVSHSHTTTAIEPDISHLIYDRFAGCNAPCNGADSREEYLKDEWLHQIVVCSQIKGFNNFGNRIDCGQDQNRRFRAACADLPQNFKSVHFWKKNI